MILMKKISVFLILAVFFVLNCSSSDLKKENGISSDFNVIFGSGGGFTGLYNGYTIKNDGSVFKWGGKLVEEDAEKIGNISAEERNTVAEKIREIDFFNINFDKIGNMNKIIVITEQGKKHKVNWPVNEGNPSIVEFYELCMSIIQKFK